MTPGAKEEPSSQPLLVQHEVFLEGTTLRAQRVWGPPWPVWLPHKVPVMFHHKPPNHYICPTAQYQQHVLLHVADGKVNVIYYRQEKQRTSGFYCCYCLLIRARTVGLMLPCSQQRAVKALGRLGHQRDINHYSESVINYIITLFCRSHFFPTHFIKVVFWHSICDVCLLEFSFSFYIFCLVILCYFSVMEMYVAFLLLVGYCSCWRKQSTRGTWTPMSFVHHIMQLSLFFYFFYCQYYFQLFRYMFIWRRYFSGANINGDTETLVYKLLDSVVAHAWRPYSKCFKGIRRDISALFMLCGYYYFYWIGLYYGLTHDPWYHCALPSSEIWYRHGTLAFNLSACWLYMCTYLKVMIIVIAITWWDRS